MKRSIGIMLLFCRWPCQENSVLKKRIDLIDKKDILSRMNYFFRGIEPTPFKIFGLINHIIHLITFD